MNATQDAPADTTGTITDVSNCGSIIVVFLTTEAGQIVPVYFDHRPFGWLLEAEQCTPDELVGRTAAFDGDGLRFEE